MYNGYKMKYIKIDNDKWDDCGKVWGVLEYNLTPASSACNLILVDPNTKETIHRTVAQHQIEWV